ncbi:MAG TPA: hypothetical protein VGH09_00305 [Solirubrobacteraceae bacterium]
MADLIATVIGRAFGALVILIIGGGLMRYCRDYADVLVSRERRSIDALFGARRREFKKQGHESSAAAWLAAVLTFATGVFFVVAAVIGFASL